MSNKDWRGGIKEQVKIESDLNKIYEEDTIDPTLAMIQLLVGNDDQLNFIKSPNREAKDVYYEFSYGQYRLWILLVSSPTYLCSSSGQHMLLARMVLQYEDKLLIWI